MITSVYRNSASQSEAFHLGADEYLLHLVEPERLVDVSRFLKPTGGRGHIPLPRLVTDEVGQIVSANAAAARLLNLTPRGARDRSLPVFCDGDRLRVIAHVRRAYGGRIEQLTATLRPRDRKPFLVDLDISATPFEREGAPEWVLEPMVESASQEPAHVQASGEGTRHALDCNDRRVAAHRCSFDDPWKCFGHVMSQEPQRQSTSPSEPATPTAALVVEQMCEPPSSDDNTGPATRATQWVPICAERTRARTTGVIVSADARQTPACFAVPRTTRTAAEAHSEAPHQARRGARARET